MVRDVSDSIPADQQQLVDRFLAAFVALKKPADRVGVVTAARDVVVQRLATAGAAEVGSGFVGDAGASDMQGTIELARAVAPPDAGLQAAKRRARRDE